MNIERGRELRLAILISVQRADESATSMPRATDKTESGARKEKVAARWLFYFCYMLQVRNGKFLDDREVRR